MATIPKVAFLALILGFSVGCEETLEPPTPTAQQQEGGGIPLDMTPRGGNSSLSGAIRAAEGTENKVNEYQERLNRQLDGEE